MEPQAGDPLTMQALAPSRVIPVVVLEDARHAEPIREALKAGGLRCAEVTFRTAAARESIRIMAQDPDFVVGAGTVVTVAQVDEATAAGARFVVSPGISAQVVRACQQARMPVFPGVLTPSEVMVCLDLGLTELKFFPAGTAGGPTAVKALGGPFGSVRFIPTGGISPQNAHEYLALPNVVAIGGTWLTPPAAFRDGDYESVSRLARGAAALGQPEGKA